MAEKTIGGWISHENAKNLANAFFTENDCPYCRQVVTAKDATMSDVDKLWCHPGCWDKHVLVEKYSTYTDDEGREWINASGACRECCEGQRGEIAGHDWGQGHFLCGSVPDDILQADKAGAISGMLHNNSWRWF